MEIVTDDDGSISMVFSFPIQRIGFTRGEAISIANALIERANDPKAQRSRMQ